MEEIIIGGVGCVFYNNGKCENPNGMSCNCINNAVCYYKELKRLEQENTRLKEENERLRDNIKSISQPVLLPDVPIEVTNKYKQTLQEIKDIAERNIFLSPKLLEINGDIGQIQNIAITQILDLITKTEEE